MNTPLYDDVFNRLVRENLGRLRAGSVLLARESLQDPNFDSAVVLVCLLNDEGAYGLVLNRPTHMPLSEIFDGFKDSAIVREVYIGGPVQQDELQILQITDSPVEGSFQIAPRVYLGGKWETVSQMVENDTNITRIFLGYAGWTRGQLEGEIELGAWDVYNVDLVNLFHELTLHPHSKVAFLEPLLKKLALVE